MSASYEARAFGVRSAMPRRSPAGSARTPCSSRPTSRPTRRTRTGSARSCSPTRRTSSRSRSTRPSSTSAGPRCSSASRRRSPRASGPRSSARSGSRARSGVAPTKFVAKLASATASPTACSWCPGARRARVPRAAPGRAAVGRGGEDRRGARAPGRADDRRPRRDPRADPLAVCSGISTLGICRELSHGVDDRPVVPYEAPKSVGHEETFDARPRRRRDLLLRELLALSGQGGRAAAGRRVPGPHGHAEGRLATFTTLTRSKTMPDATDVGADLYQSVPPSSTAGCRATAGACACSVAGQRTRARGRRAARAAPGRAMGGRGAGGGPHRAPVRPRRGDARPPARSRARAA